MVLSYIEDCWSRHSLRELFLEDSQSGLSGLKSWRVEGRERSLNLGGQRTHLQWALTLFIQWSHTNLHFINSSCRNKTKQVWKPLISCQILKFMEVVTEAWGVSSGHSITPHFCLTWYRVSILWGWNSLGKIFRKYSPTQLPPRKWRTPKAKS